MAPGLQIRGFLHEPELVAAFIDLPYQVYADDPRWIMPPRAKEAAALAADEPFFRHGRERRFLAFRNGKAVARCAAIVNDRLVEEPTDGAADEDGEARPVGLVGFFDALYDPAATSRLLDEACAWLKAQGLRSVRGPMNRDTWHKYRVMTSGFDGDPIMLEPYNKPWYGRCFEAAGFSTIARYCSTYNEDMEPTLAKNRRLARFATRKGCTVRPIDMGRFEEELETLYTLSIAAFPDNYSYSPIDLDEFKDLYRPSRAIIDPSFVQLGFDKKGEPAGYAFCLPELSHALAAMKGDEGLRGKLAFLLARRENKGILNFKTLAAVPSARGKGLASLLTVAAYEAGQAAGCTHSRHCLMKVDNVSTRFDGGTGVVVKEYALYGRELER